MTDIKTFLEAEKKEFERLCILSDGQFFNFIPAHDQRLLAQVREIVEKEETRMVRLTDMGEKNGVYLNKEDLLSLLTTD